MYSERIMEDKVLQSNSLPSYLRECRSYLKEGYISKQDYSLLVTCFKRYAKEGNSVNVYLMFDSMPVRCQKAFNSIVLKVSCLERLNSGLSKIRRG